MAKQPTGFVIYEGPSMLTGAPIVAIATARGIAQPAAKRGLAKKRSCYVDLVHGPLGIWTAWRAGRYPRVQGHAAIAAIGHGRKVRLGAYGDPAAVPAYVNQSLVSECEGHTAYSHQSEWEGPTGFDPSIMMVSADSLSGAQDAWERGARTFRVIADPLELEPRAWRSSCTAPAGSTTVHKGGHSDVVCDPADARHQRVGAVADARHDARFRPRRPVAANPRKETRR